MQGMDGRMVLVDKNKVIKKLKKYLDEDYLDGYKLWNDIESLPVCEDAISKRALIDEILEDGNGAVLSYPAGIYEDELVENIEKQMIEYFIAVVNYMPPVKPERPTGEWVRTKNPIGETIVVCSNCGKIRQQGYDNFCGFCGADMRGEEND